MNTFTVNEIAGRLNISYQTARYRVAKLFGRTTGVFTEDEANQVAYFHEVSRRLDCTAKVLEQQVGKMSENTLPESSGRLTDKREIGHFPDENTFTIDLLGQMTETEMDQFFTHWNEQPFKIRRIVIEKLTNANYIKPTEAQQIVQSIKPLQVESAYEKYGF